MFTIARCCVLCTVCVYDMYNPYVNHVSIIIYKSLKKCLGAWSIINKKRFSSGNSEFKKSRLCITDVYFMRYRNYLYKVQNFDPAGSGYKIL